MSSELMTLQQDRITREARLADFNGVNLRDLPIFVYGNSYAIVTGGGYAKAMKYWPQLLKAETNGGALTSYAVSGQRIADVLNGLLNGTAQSGGYTPVAGSTWPGVSSRRGLTVLDCITNDYGHYPSMTGTALPATITTSNTKYIDSMVACYRTALALMSTETRIEQGSATFSGTWTNQAFASGVYSGGTAAYSSTVGATVTFTVTPPQEGPLAGRVFLMLWTLDSASGTIATTSVAVDGGAASYYTAPVWEAYTGTGSVTRSFCPWVIPVDLPIDGASHSVAFAHAGSAGHYIYVDVMLVPSDNPNPILNMNTERMTTGTWNSTQVAAWRYNRNVLEPYIRDVTAEFPHAAFVESTMTTNGLYTSDGIHPNERGMEQRKNDALAALQETNNWFRNYELSTRSNSNWSVI